MSNHKHTPGPWKVRKVVDNSGDYPFPNYDILALLDYGPQGIADAYNNPYNARLIAAAPALLEALEAVEWVVDYKEPLTRHGDNYRFCPHCRAEKYDGHNDSCKLGNALKLVRGER